MRSPLILLPPLMIFLLASCGSDEQPKSSKGEPGTEQPEATTQAPPPKEGGAQLVTPAFTVPSGAEIFECMRVPFEIKEDLYVQSSAAWQAPGGHHMLIYYSEGSVVYKDEPHACDGTDMLDVRLIGVGGADGVGIAMPPGVTLKIPAGAKIYGQSHYVNTTSKDITAKDTINLELLPFEKVENVAGTWAEINSTFELKPHETSTVSVTCSPPEAGKVPWIIPHMHEYGKHITIEHIVDNVTNVLYDSDWGEALREHFPLTMFAEHLSIKPTDKFRTTCTWDNTTPGSILWPKEMCVAFMAYYPSSSGALWACDADGSNFTP